MKSEREILADIRRLRHLLDRQRLTKAQAALAAAQREIEALRAQLRTPSPASTAESGRSSSK